MDKFISSKMLSVDTIFGNASILDKIKEPVIVTVDNASAYAEHLSATQLISALNSNSLDNAIATRTSQYNTLSTRSETHMLRALKELIRMDTLLTQGYKYLVVKIPAFYVVRTYNGKRDYHNPGWGSGKCAHLHLCDINSSGKPIYTATNAAIGVDQFFKGPPSVNSMHPFNLVGIEGPHASDAGAVVKSGDTYDMQYAWIGIDLNYAVNVLGCKACALATVGFSGDYYYSLSIDLPAGHVSHLDSEMIVPITYYYM